MKKSLCLVIAVVMLMSALSACGGGAIGVEKTRAKYPEISDDIWKAVETIVATTDEVLDGKRSLEGAKDIIEPLYKKINAVDLESIPESENNKSGDSTARDCVRGFQTLSWTLTLRIDTAIKNKEKKLDRPEDMMEIAHNRNFLAERIGIEGRAR